MNQDQLRILIVDDSADDAELMARSLRRGGFAPRWERVATPRAIAGALAVGRCWDVITCDARLPGLEATRVLAAAHAAMPDVPLLLVSGRMPDEIGPELRLASAFVSKDQLGTLPATIRALLRGT